MSREDWSPQRRALHLRLRRIRYRQRHPKRERPPPDPATEARRQQRRAAAAAGMRQRYWRDPEQARQEDREYWDRGYGAKRNARRRNARTVAAMRARAAARLEAAA